MSRIMKQGFTPETVLASTSLRNETKRAILKAMLAEVERALPAGKTNEDRELRIERRSILRAQHLLREAG